MPPLVAEAVSFIGQKKRFRNQMEKIISISNWLSQVCCKQRRVIYLLIIQERARLCDEIAGQTITNPGSGPEGLRSGGNGER